MANNLHWSSDDLKKRGLVQDASGNYVPVKSLAPKGKVEKLANLLERAIYTQGLDKFKTVKNGEFTYHLQDPFKENKPAENKKVHNAVKSTNAEGVKFDSNLERHMYGLLKGARIYFNFQVPYVLQEKFAYGTENIRAITLTVDFFLPGKNMIIDTKGMQTQQGTMRYKMLKKHLVDTQLDNLPVIELPATKDECNLLLNRLLYQS